MSGKALRLTPPRIVCPYFSRLRCSNHHASWPALHRYTFNGIRPFGTSNRGMLHPFRSLQPRFTVSRGLQLALLLAAVGTVYNISTEPPLRLDSSDHELRRGEKVVYRYFSPITPCTIQQANEMLRWEEDSHVVGMGSGIQRFDSIRIASNMPCEDNNVAAASHPEDDEITWQVNPSTSAGDILFTPISCIG
jgi:hypothetical protein